MRRILLSVLKIAVSAALLYLALGKVDFAALSARFSASSIGWIAAAVAVCVAQIGFAGARWHLLSESCGAPLSKFAATRFILIGVFFNQTLPSSIGGDAVRIWLVGRRVGWRTATYSVFIDRAIGLMALAVLILACLPWSLDEIRDTHARFGLLFIEAGALAASVGFLAFGALPARWVDRWTPLHHVGRSATMAWRALTQPRNASGLYALSLSIHALNAVIAWCAARAIGAEVSFFQLFLLMPPVSLITLVPISIAGWGLRETALGAAFASAGLAAADGVAVSLVYGATNFLIGGLGGLIWIVSAEKAEKGTKPIDVPVVP